MLTSDACGADVYVCVGGVLQLLTKKGEHHVYLNRRRGFIKVRACET